MIPVTAASPPTRVELDARVSASIAVATLLAAAAMVAATIETTWIVGQGLAFSLVTFVAMAPAFGRGPVVDEGPAITRRHRRLLLLAGVALLVLAGVLTPRADARWDEGYLWLIYQAFAVPVGILLGIVGGMVVLAMVVLPARVIADHVGRGGQDLGLVLGLIGFGLIVPMLTLVGLSVGFGGGPYGGPGSVLAIWIPGVPTRSEPALIGARALFALIAGCFVLARVLRVRPLPGEAATGDRGTD